MKNKAFYILFSVLLVAYAFLYIATRKVEKCEDECLQLRRVSEVLRQRPYVQSARNCNQKIFCVHVKDTTGINWQALADTFCVVLKSQNLLNYRVAITKYNATTTTVDTLANKMCN